MMIVVLLFLPGGLATLLERITSLFRQTYYRD